MIPLILKLKKQMHKEIALCQDMIIKDLYNVFNKAVLHGGTAIWRCYDGNRFSEDIDIYIPKDLDKIDLLFKNFKKIGFKIEKKKITESALFSNLSLNKCIVRLEAIFKKNKGVLKDYKTSDGNIITIYSLNPEELIKEKARAYLKRFKIRDLYDIFFLLKHVKNKKIILNDLNKLIKEFKKPVDEGELKILIIEGVIPNVSEILEYIKWESKNT